MLIGLGPSHPLVIKSVTKGDFGPLRRYRLCYYTLPVILMRDPELPETVSERCLLLQLQIYAMTITLRYLYLFVCNITLFS